MSQLSAPKERTVRCPRCGKPSLFTPENPFRPFCSERCKVIDLGAWADEKYSIPVESAPGADREDELASHDDSAGDDEP